MSLCNKVLLFVEENVRINVNRFYHVFCLQMHNSLQNTILPFAKTLLNPSINALSLFELHLYSIHLTFNATPQLHLVLFQS